MASPLLGTPEPSPGSLTLTDTSPDLVPEVPRYCVPQLVTQCEVCQRPAPSPSGCYALLPLVNTARDCQTFKASWQCEGEQQRKRPQEKKRRRKAPSEMHVAAMEVCTLLSLPGRLQLADSLPRGLQAVPCLVLRPCAPPAAPASDSSDKAQHLWPVWASSQGGLHSTVRRAGRTSSDCMADLASPAQSSCLPPSPVVGAGPAPPSEGPSHLLLAFSLYFSQV